MNTKVEVPDWSLNRVLKAQRGMAVEDVIAINEGLEKCGHVILRKSNFYCPIETGELRASGKVVTVGKGLNAKSTVEYFAPYALPVHEILAARHAPPTTAKFLERAVRETRGTCTALLGRQLAIGKRK
jgi:hypothetical protein